MCPHTSTTLSLSLSLARARALSLQVIDPKVPTTCPAGKRHRIVTNLPLFPPDLLKSYGGLLAADDNSPEPLVIFPETEQPIVIVRSRSRVAEVFSLLVVLVQFTCFTSTRSQL
jgi:hypothetical protein